MKVQKYKHKIHKYDSHTTSLSCCTSTQQCKYKNMQSKQIHKICVCVSINRKVSVLLTAEKYTTSGWKNYNLSKYSSKVVQFNEVLLNRTAATASFCIAVCLCFSVVRHGAFLSRQVNPRESPNHMISLLLVFGLLCRSQSR